MFLEKIYEMLTRKYTIEKFETKICRNIIITQIVSGWNISLLLPYKRGIQIEYKLYGCYNNIFTYSQKMNMKAVREDRKLVSSVVVEKNILKAMKYIYEHNK